MLQFFIDFALNNRGISQITTSVVIFAVKPPIWQGITTLFKEALVLPSPKVNFASEFSSEIFER